MTPRDRALVGCRWPLACLLAVGCAAPSPPPAPLTPNGTPLTWRSDLSTTKAAQRVAPVPQAPSPPADKFEQQLDEWALHPPTAVLSQQTRVYPEEHAETLKYDQRGRNTIFNLPTTGDAEADSGIREHCEEQHSDNFSLQKLCIELQVKAYFSVNDFYERYDDRSDPKYYTLRGAAKTIAAYCRQLHPDNFSLENLCIEHQVNAARSLGRMD